MDSKIIVNLKITHFANGIDESAVICRLKIGNAGDGTGSTPAFQLRGLSFDYSNSMRRASVPTGVCHFSLVTA
jgi:hypothetical protein